MRRAAPEDGPQLEHAGHVGADGHLLVELGGLRQAALAAHVVQAEDGRATLGRARDQLGRVYLLEPLRQQHLPEQLRACDTFSFQVSSERVHAVSLLP